MNAVDKIKGSIKQLFQINSTIHISIAMKYPKLNIEDREARIKAIYPSIFQVESNGKCYTLQYTDILIKDVKIAEIDKLDQNRDYL